MWLPDCFGSPTCCSLAIFSANATAWSYTLCSTRTRAGASQLWPVFSNTNQQARRMVASRSGTSAKIIFGDFPPNSRLMRLISSAAAWKTLRPARVEPVKLTMSTAGWLLIAAPTVGPSPFTKLKTPFGTPAASMTSAKIIVEIGATSLGFNTIVHPAAMAAPTFMMTCSKGQFHGVIIPTTPAGSRRMRAPGVSGSLRSSKSICFRPSIKPSILKRV